MLGRHRQYAHIRPDSLAGSILPPYSVAPAPFPNPLCRPPRVTAHHHPWHHCGRLFVPCANTLATQWMPQILPHLRIRRARHTRLPQSTTCRPRRPQRLPPPRLPFPSRLPSPGHRTPIPPKNLPQGSAFSVCSAWALSPS